MRDGVLAADLNYDFKTDLVIAGGRGLTLLRQQEGGTFADVTAAARLPDAVRSSAAVGAWAADIDTDGDLDVVTAPIEGPARVLRNNGDGTFAVQEPFARATRVRGFVWADADGDGVPDAALLDAAGVTRTYINARGGMFRERPVPSSFPKAVALAAAEVTDDSVMDVLALAPTGAIMSLSQSPDGTAWTAREVARVAPFNSDIASGAASLLIADLDNNGAADLVGCCPFRRPCAAARTCECVATARRRRFLSTCARPPISTATVVSIWLGSRPDGRAATAKSRGRSAVRWQTLRPHAATATGDQRINSFGIGGEVELRTGTARAEAPDYGTRRPHRHRHGKPEPRSCASSGRTARSNPSSTSPPMRRSRLRSASRARARGSSPGTAARWPLSPTCSGDRRSACASTRSRPPTC